VASDLGTEPVVGDFTRLADVRAAAARVLAACPRIDVLLLNAGGIFPRRRLTADDHETTFQVNHLAGFCLTQLLMGRLLESARQQPVRVIVTASGANLWGDVRVDDLDWEKRRWSSMRAYSTTKLENILFAAELARRTTRTGISSYSVHPGTVASAFGRDSGSLVGLVYRTPLRRMLASEADGAVPLEFLASTASVPAASGTYFDRLAAGGRTHRQARDAALSSALWERSLALC
jgi:NAD(P)-dependent dehydrogenase (short-subunit alcohol dehydrogenase family)